MIVRKPENREELIKCVDLYLALNDQSFIPADRKSSIASIIKFWKSGEFIRVIENDDIVGFITAQIHVLQHCKHKQLDQIYYASNLKGFSAARAVIVAHEAMIEYAEANSVPFVVTHSSHEDEQNVLCKILQKRGWRVKSHVAVWRTRHAQGM